MPIPLFAAILGLPDVVFWIIVMVVFVVIEGMTLLLVAIWFAGGALAAVIAAAAGASLPAQVALFVIVSLVLLLIGIALRRYWLPGRQPVATNADRIIGEEGRVITAINPVERAGQIEVMGQIWSAVTEDESELPVGSRVVVLEIRGVRAVVRSRIEDQ